MKVAIMQPYFLPYIGYFQLIAAVDVFILYDNIKYTKKGWINRNRILQNGQDHMFSLPLKRDSDYLNICQRNLSMEFNREKLLNQFKAAYRQAPHFDQTFSLIEEIVRFETENLFEYIRYSIVKICAYLHIPTQIRISSGIAIDHTLKNQRKVLALCEAVRANVYVNAIGGVALYSKETFQEKNIELRFIQSGDLKYPQLNNEFVPWLSIVDVMMFNSQDSIKRVFLKDINYS